VAVVSLPDPSATKASLLPDRKLKTKTADPINNKIVAKAVARPKEKLPIVVDCFPPRFSVARRALSRKSKSQGAATVPRLDTICRNFNCSS